MERAYAVLLLSCAVYSTTSIQVVGADGDRWAR
jgi:hypothetical protein